MLSFIKKHKIISSIVILFLVLEGLFIWLILSSWPNEDEYERVVKPGSFEVVINDLGERFIVNEEVKLKAKVPEDWITKPSLGVSLSSPEVSFGSTDEYIESLKSGGCIIGISVIKDDPDDPYDVIYWDNHIKDIQNKGGFYKEEDILWEVVLVDSYLGLKLTTEVGDGEALLIDVRVPVDNAVHSFSSGLIYTEECIVQMDNFLKTVSINK